MKCRAMTKLLTGSSSPKPDICWRHTWPWLLLNLNFLLSWRGASLWSGALVSEIFIPWSLRMGVYIYDWPPWAWLGVETTTQRGHTYKYIPFWQVSLTHLGAKGAGKQILYWRRGRTQIYPPSWIIPPLEGRNSVGRMRMKGSSHNKPNPPLPHHPIGGGRSREKLG